MSRVPIVLDTERLVLRQWVELDRGPWARMNADAEVRRYFPGVLSEDEANVSLDQLSAGIAERGWGFWSLEVKTTAEFIGFTGVKPVDDERIPVCGEVEIGWRLARSAWGHGFATEAARAALDFAFEELELARVVAYTPTGNAPSRAVMERLGMVRDRDADFDHPALPNDHPLRRHVLYTISPEPTRLGGTSFTA